MLYAGREITNPNDKLVKVPLEYVYHSLKNPKPEILSRIRQLRIAYNVDRKFYSKMKRFLPYLVCGVFNPPYRKTDNFASICYFIIDIDHVSEKGANLSELRIKIESDTRVVLSFLSPSEDGLKVLFRLKEKCYDAGIYSIFYKLFATDFSRLYDLEQIVDSKTCDVSRACFMSSDPNAYYNPEADPVDMDAYMCKDDTSLMLELKKNLENNTGQFKASTIDRSDNIYASCSPSEDEFAKIREILKLKTVKRNAAPVYVPHQLDEIIDDVKRYVEDTGVQIYEIINISYGKKVRLKMNMKMAEVNIFYGKKGFTVTISPRCGTNDEFNELCKELISSYLSLL